jgi:hypothetical protein
MHSTGVGSGVGSGVVVGNGVGSGVGVGPGTKVFSGLETPIALLLILFTLSLNAKFIAFIYLIKKFKK